MNGSGASTTVALKRDTTTRARLAGRWLWAARAVVGVIALVVMTMYVLGIRIRIDDLRIPCIPNQCSTLHLSTEGAGALKEGLGITPLTFAILTAGLESYVTLVFFVSGVVIASRKSDDVMALFSSAVLMIGGVGNLAFLDTLVQQVPVFNLPARLVQTLAYPLLVLLFYIFPDGQFSPRWLRWPAFLGTLAFVAVSFAYGAISSPGLVSLVIVLAGGIFSQIYRYRSVSSPPERQQTKWVVAGFAVMFLGIALIAVIFPLWPLTFGPSGVATISSVSDFVLVVPMAFLILFLPISLVPITFAISTLRFGLWDVDPILNRSLVYGSLTLLLGGIFVGAFFGLRALLGSALGSSQDLIAVAVPAVGVMALFNPAQRILRRFVDQRVYGIQLDYVEALKAYRGKQAEAKSQGTRTSFGSYSGLELLGRGGMGEVYRAQHPTLNRAVAIKILPPHAAADVEAHKRFLREAQTVARLKHPNIVTLFDVGEQDQTPYMVMEYVDGKDLSDLLKERGRFPLGEALPILTDIASALDYAHAQGIIHRDIKPSNIMVEKVTATGSGRAARAVLMDFGIAKSYAATSKLTSTGMIGTLDYISPEQIQGAAEVDARADIYSFGVMAYQLLTGELPFRHNNPGAMVLAHLNQPAPDPRDKAPDLPEGVAVAVMRSMSKKPEDRFGTVGEMVAAWKVIQ